MKYKVVGKDEEAIEAYNKFMAEVGKYELAFERWYDHGLAFEYMIDKVTSKTVMGVDDLDAM